MFRRTRLTDADVEQLLAGGTVTGFEGAAAFADDVKLAATSATAPSAALAAMFAEGLSATDPAAASTRRTAIAPRRKKTMIEALLAKLAAAGMLAKGGIAAGALTFSATAAAATGALPDAAQDRVADAVDKVGVNIPGGTETDDESTEVVKDDNSETPEQAEFGQDVSDAARSGAPQEDGADFGEQVSNDAREAHQPTDTPTADENPGTDAREGAGSQAPETRPTADENPGTDAREGAGSQAPETRPTADENPGADARDGATAGRP